MFFDDEGLKRKGRIYGFGIIELWENCILNNIIKNAMGVIGIVVIISICIKPILNLAALSITYYLGAALCEPIADEKIVGIMEQIGGTFKIFLAVMFGITALLIIGIAIVMKLSNSGLMYN